MRVYRAANGQNSSDVTPPLVGADLDTQHLGSRADLGVRISDRTSSIYIRFESSVLAIVRHFPISGYPGFLVKLL